MKLQVGKKYVAQNGAVIGPMVDYFNACYPLIKFKGAVNGSGSHRNYREDGTREPVDENYAPGYAIVAEYSDPATAPQLHPQYLAATSSTRSLKCECGGEKHGWPHSHWCPCFEEAA